MGYVVPEALAEAGVQVVFLNHAEHSLKLEELVKKLLIELKKMICIQVKDSVKKLCLLQH